MTELGHPAIRPLDSVALGQFTVAGAAVSAWLSAAPSDPVWDRFLEQTPLGQYQQSSFWASYKALDGWRAARVILTRRDELIGGFQALIRSSRKGNIGYITKGPVLLPAHTDAAPYLLQLLREFVKRQKLLGLVVQLPDFSEGELVLPEAEFLPFVLEQVVDATWLLDLRGGYEAAAGGFNKTTRTQLRRAVKNGFVAREGGREDLGAFFDLMVSGCQRHGVKPNPPTAEHLYTLWDAACPGGQIRLCIVEHDGVPVVAELCLAFGQTWSLWRTGRIPSEGQNNPTEFSIDNALRHACADGRLSFCDFGSFDRAIASKILAGEPWDREQLDGRHTFHIRFGGFPRLLPQARIYIPNPLLRLAYRGYAAWKSARSTTNAGESRG